MKLFATRVLQAVLDADILRTRRSGRSDEAPTELRALTCEWGTLLLLVPLRSRTRVLLRFAAAQHRWMSWLKSALVAGEVSVAQAGDFAGELCGATLQPRLVLRVASQINWEIVSSIRRQMLCDYPWLNSLERVHARALRGGEE